jgi:ABC-type branched-subunit amino acid transport system substrate-binding protein
MGLSFKRGVELYSNDNRDAGVSFVFEDHKYDGRATVTAMHALKAQTGVDLVVVWGNAPSSAAAPLAEQQRIPTLAVSMNPDAKDRNFVVTFGPPAAKVADTIAAYFKQTGASNYGAIGIDMGNVLEVFDMVEHRVHGFSSRKVVSATEVDFKPVISNFKSRSIDSLVLFLLPEQALTFLKQARQMDYSPSIIGGDIFATETFQSQAAQLTSKVAFVYGAVKPEFIRRLSDSEAGRSYFFEVATGYSVAAMSAELVKRKRVGDAPFVELDALSLESLPIPAIKYRSDDSLGRHFEVDAAVYTVPMASNE